MNKKILFLFIIFSFLFITCGNLVKETEQLNKESEKIVNQVDSIKSSEKYKNWYYGGYGYGEAVREPADVVYLNEKADSIMKWYEKLKNDFLSDTSNSNQINSDSLLNEIETQLDSLSESL